MAPSLFPTLVDELLVSTGRRGPPSLFSTLIDNLIVPTRRRWASPGRRTSSGWFVIIIVDIPLFIAAKRLGHLDSCTKVLGFGREIDTGWNSGLRPDEFRRAGWGDLSLASNASVPFFAVPDRGAAQERYCVTLGGVQGEVKQGLGWPVQGMGWCRVVVPT